MELIAHTPFVYPQQTNYIQPTAFARAIGVTRGTVCYWIRKGRLPNVIQRRSGYYKIPAHYIELVQCGELPLAPDNQRSETIPFSPR